MFGPKTRLLLPTLSYLVIFAALCFPWLHVASHAAPGGHDSRDTRLIVWTLAWVARSLCSAPSTLFDAPIFYPAANQLASTEHLLTYQAIYLPIFSLVHNELLATNLLVFSTYPLAALLMRHFQLSLGIGSAAAWVGGLAFALSNERVPASFQVLQYGNFFLPLLGIALRRYWRAPSLRSAAPLFVVYLGAIFSSYYLGVIATITLLVLTIFELMTQAHGGLLRVAWLIAVIGTATVILFAFSRPYFAHNALNVGASYTAAGTVDTASPTATDQLTKPGLMSLALLRETLLPPLSISLLAVLGVVAICQRRLRPVVLLGWSLIALSAVIVTGYGLMQVVHWFPFLAFFRSSSRFRVMGFFGVCLLAGAGLDALRSIAPRIAIASIGISAIALCLGPGRDLVPRMDEIAAYGADAEAYRAVDELTSKAGKLGALLEVPPIATGLRDHSPDAMAGSIRHRLPLVAGYAGYDPPQRALYLRLFGQLPDEDVLEDLIDLTHVQWLLVRPSTEWPSPEARARYLRQLDASASAGPTYSLGEWQLRRLNRSPRHESWFEAIAEGPRPGQSLLGSSLARLSKIDGLVELLTGEDVQIAAGSARWLPIRLTNRGDVPWPVVTGGDVPTPGQVYLRITWMLLRDDGAEMIRQTESQVRRDVPPKESLSQPILLVAPPLPGDYRVRVEVAQRPIDGESPEPIGATVKVQVSAKADQHPGSGS